MSDPQPAKLYPRGIERLVRLQQPDPHFARGNGYYPPIDEPRLAFMSAGEIQIEVAYALIEELHDALDRLRDGVKVLP